MNRKIIVTDDNSKSLLIPEINETYHSINGAMNEALHVFITNGLIPMADKKHIRIFEMGFGTGLNALLSLNCIKNTPIYIAYETIEKFPVELELINQLQHPQTTGLTNLQSEFETMHSCQWNETIEISSAFRFKKNKSDIKDIELPLNNYDVIYYDAFSPKIQPELWTTSILTKLYASMVEGGRLTTYCAQGQFKRNLKEVGFSVHGLPGPKGKREMTLAIKPLVN